MSALNWEFVDNGKLGAVVVFLLQGTEAEEVLERMVRPKEEGRS